MDNNRKRKARTDDDYYNEHNKARRDTVQRDAAQAAHIVAKHYNERPELGREKRKESKIIRLRSFNNWVKSVLIQRYVRARSTVLDMGCGKGGDLLKYAIARISYLVAADVAEVSLEQMKDRYKNMRRRTFSAEFHPIDCYKERLEPRLHRNIRFDSVSMQFCMHYAFENENMARTMLENVTSRLRRGGTFLGTIPDANWIVKRVRQEPPGSFGFGNSIYRIDFENIKDTNNEEKKTGFTRYGCKYMFHLEDAVDCPEYLVHWPTFERLAAEYGLKLKFKQNFHELYESASKNPEMAKLLPRLGVIGGENAPMSEEEWEAARIYLAFMFEKE